MNDSLALGIELGEASAVAVVIDGAGSVVGRGEQAHGESAAGARTAAQAAISSIGGRKQDGDRRAGPGEDQVEPGDREVKLKLRAIGMAAIDAARPATTTALREIARELGDVSTPGPVLSSGAALAVGEAWRGAAKGARHVIAFTLGDRTSAGIVSDGRVWGGAHGLAGSVAWLALNPVEREDYRRLGCLEAEVGAPGIVRRLVWRIKAGDQSRALDLAGGNLAAITITHILTAARNGDGVAISVVRDTVRYIGMAVANLAATIDPEVVVLGGLMKSAADLLLEPIRQECARRLPAAIAEGLRIEVSALGGDGPAIGAARRAMTDLS